MLASAEQYRDQRKKDLSMIDLEVVFAEAAVIAKKVPKNLQEAAFNRAVDELLGGRSKAKSGVGATNRHTRRNRAESSGDAAASGLLEGIDRTKYPDIGATTRVADRALKVLKLAHDDHGVDGLTAIQIAEVLTKKFRLPVKTHAIRMALERESGTVDVRSGAGGSRVFHIMAAGDAYIERLRSGEESVERRRRKAPQRKSQAKKAQAKKSGTARKEKASAKKNSASKTSGRPGPKAAIGQLMQADFFRSSRTISDIQKELRHKRGHAYTVQDLSPALVRCVRDESLTRERNESGQYEYTKA